MTTAQPRNVSAELNRGMIDGTYKQISRDRGGVVESSTYSARRDLDDVWFGIHQKDGVVLPDTRISTAAGYVPNPEADPKAIG